MPDHIRVLGYAAIIAGMTGVALAVDRPKWFTIAIRRLVAIAAVPWRGWLWTVAQYRWWRRTRAAWRAGLDLPTWTPAPALSWPRPGTQERCPTCRGRRCANHRAGLHCPPQRAPRLTDTLGGGGEHEPSVVLGRIVEPGWRPPLPLWRTLRERVGELPQIGVLP